ncbi:hypothetical protein ACFO0A_10350 [Novosphingobium tardum]|uniref:Phytoene synthase n=1 Tax=Novosphingobium tardum TaxID=1538021 RepID=A0ABV8RRS9_9SPHN
MWEGLLRLDARLARTALGAREPLLGQLKLAWWRDRMAQPTADWPRGEPLLAILVRWETEREVLGQLVDAWEGAVGGSPAEPVIARIAEGRADAFAALGRIVGMDASVEDAVRLVGRAWALSDLSVGLPEPEGRAAASRLLAAQDARPPALPRDLRPLAILADIARGESEGEGTLRRFARIIRLGIIGR